MHQSSSAVGRRGGVWIIPEELQRISTHPRSNICEGLLRGPRSNICEGLLRGCFLELQIEHHEQLQGLSMRSGARAPRGRLISGGTLPILVFPFHYSHKCSPDFHSDFMAPTMMFYTMQANAIISFNTRKLYISHNHKMGRFGVSLKAG